jgi:phage tail-like protein
MRGDIGGLCSPHPLGDTLPSVYRGDVLAEQLCGAFDDVLAPIFATLDCLPAYLDPHTAPADMLDWLAGWIGLAVNIHDEPARKRELITAGASLLPWRGTVRSVYDAVVAAFNLPTEVIESGAATWSTQPDSEPGGQPVPTLIVRVTVETPDDIDRRSLDAIVDSVKPAHMPHRVEVSPRSTPPSPGAAAAVPPAPGPTAAPVAPGAAADETPPSPAGDGEPPSTADDETSVISIVDVDDTPPAAGDGEKPSDS